MFFSTTRICIIASRYLVEAYYEGVHVTAPLIAERFDINVRSVNPALRQLVQAGILDSQTGGANPGFMFSRDPKMISLYDIIVAFNEDKPMECCRNRMKGVECGVDNCSKCIVFSEVNSSLNIFYNQMKEISLYNHALSIDGQK